ncbi:MAG: GIY-YIG nuclease family protein [Patescibacteria group bacterium]
MSLRAELDGAWQSLSVIERSLRGDVAISPPTVIARSPTTWQSGRMHQYFVYILTNKYKTVLYTGVTNDLIKRLFEHKNKLIKDSFTAKYNADILVYFENTEDAYSAISREKQIKAGSRAKKVELINTMNPEWKDLSVDWS